MRLNSFLRLSAAYFFILGLVVAFTADPNWMKYPTMILDFIVGAAMIILSFAKEKS